ncbi:MAG: response regulator [Chloroflexales bacterium]|nr:response regulator [Chloroflexales bacterium]
MNSDQTKTRAELLAELATLRHQASGAAEQRALERSYLEAQRLESLGRLAGGVAHDFNNLLMAIMGNSELVERELPGDAQAHVHLAAIQLAARRAADLTRQLMAYAGKGKAQIQPVDINTLVVEMAQLLRTSVTRTIPLRYELGAQLPTTLADAAQLRQVLLNLLTNAAEASTDSGAITISTGWRGLDAATLAQLNASPGMRPGTFVTIAVADSGNGIDADALRHIFEPFFSTKFAGRGLGLATVQGIVFGHGGGLLAESVPGRGTTITVLLPAAPSLELAAPTKARSAVEYGGIVLVVDDDPAVRHVAQGLLAQLGYDALLAGDGFDGIAQVEKRGNEIGCVLLDLTMPRMDGVRAYAAIQHLEPGLPVVLMTGYHEPEVHERYHGIGLAGFLQKPFTSETLRGLLAHVI